MVDTDHEPLKTEKIIYEYTDVILSLDNRITDESILNNSPSSLDSIPSHFENYLRFFGCTLIQVAGCLLKLPQIAMATAQMLFQRFYYSKSFLRHDAEIQAIAAIFLAAKIEEHPRRARDVINVFRYLKQKRFNREILPMEYFCEEYLNLKAEVIKAERRILKIGLPENPHWWLLFDLNEETLIDICTRIVEPDTLEIDSFLQQKRIEQKIVVMPFTIESSIRPKIVPQRQESQPKSNNGTPSQRNEQGHLERELNHSSSKRYHRPSSYSRRQRSENSPNYSRDFRSGNRNRLDKYKRL